MPSALASDSYRHELVRVSYRLCASEDRCVTLAGSTCLRVRTPIAPVPPAKRWFGYEEFADYRFTVATAHLTTL